jgi:hypothetical protein
MTFWEQFTAEDRAVTQTFATSINQIEDSRFKNEMDRPDLNSIAAKAGIRLRDYSKDGIVLQALWIYYLSKIRSNKDLTTLKYPTIEQFLEAYKDMLGVNNKTELENLWHTANWMAELFKIIPAYKNKGLAIMIIPKLIEGWDAKYITGSGQKEVTKNRVTIFETEGNIKPNYRGKLAPKSKSAVSKSASSLKPKEYRRSYKRKLDTSFTEMVLPRRVTRPRSYSDESRRHIDGVTDDDSTSVSVEEYRTNDSQQLGGPEVPRPWPMVAPTGNSTEEDDLFFQALSLFRDVSGKLSMSRANSCGSTFSGISALIDFDEVVPPLPQWSNQVAAP